MEHCQQQFKPPSQFDNLLIIARFELVRLFQTPRGLLSIAAFAIIWYFILRYPILEAANIISINGFKESMAETFGEIGLSNLLQWPVAEFVVFWLFSLFLFPVFSVLITADQTSSDRARGTLRFLTLRASRDSIFFGRFLGQMAIQSMLIIGVLLATFAMSVWNNSDHWSAAMLVATIMGVNLFIVILPFTAMMALLSASVGSSRLAIIVSIIGWGITLGLVNYLAYKFPALAFLAYLVPGKQLPDLILSNDWATLQHSFLPLAQTIVLLMVGRTVLARSSL